MISNLCAVAIVDNPPMYLSNALYDGMLLEGNNK